MMKMSCQKGFQGPMLPGDGGLTSRASRHLADIHHQPESHGQVNRIVIEFHIRFLHRKTIAGLQGQGVSYRLPTFSGFEPPHNVADVLLSAHWSLIIIV